MLNRLCCFQKIMTYLFDFPHGPKVMETFILLLQWISESIVTQTIIIWCIYVCSLVHHTGLGNPTLTWFWWMLGSLSSLEREQSCDRLTLWACSFVRKPNCSEYDAAFSWLNSWFLVYIALINAFSYICHFVALSDNRSVENWDLHWTSTAWNRLLWR